MVCWEIHFQGGESMNVRAGNVPSPSLGPWDRFQPPPCARRREPGGGGGAPFALLIPAVLGPGVNVLMCQSAPGSLLRTLTAQPGCRGEGTEDGKRPSLNYTETLGSAGGLVAMDSDLLNIGL